MKVGVNCWEKMAKFSNFLTERKSPFKWLDIGNKTKGFSSIKNTERKCFSNVGDVVL